MGVDEMFWLLMTDETCLLLDHGIFLYQKSEDVVTLQL